VTYLKPHSKYRTKTPSQILYPKSESNCASLQIESDLGHVLQCAVTEEAPYLMSTGSVPGDPLCCRDQPAPFLGYHQLASS
jgi:hypothetical protein